MVKQESSVPGVYLVGPSGGKLRPWCGHCHKFLKSEDAAHDCTPVNLQAARRNASSGSGKRRRNPRLTPRKIQVLEYLAGDAAINRAMERYAKKIVAAKTPKARASAAAAYARHYVKIGSKIQKSIDSTMRKFVK